MTELIKALDVSVYSGRTSAQWWRDRYAEGWRLAIVGLWHGNSTNPFCQIQLGYARDAGFDLAGYVALSRWHGGDEQVEEARHACGDFWPLLEFVAIDMELPGLTQAQLVDALAVLVFQEKQPCLYTGYWWWEPWIAKQDFTLPNLPAWVAYYDGRASLDMKWLNGIMPMQLLTGLGPIIGKQYAGTTIIDGVAVDLNVFDRAFLKEEPTVDWPKAKLELLNQFLDWWDLFPETDGEKKDGVRQVKENNAYRQFYERQIAWRSPPR